jgi:hypothetical protein
MAKPRSIRERFPPPWRLEELPAGFRIVDGRGVALVYVCSANDDVRSATPGVTLSRPEALAICQWILRLPELG